MGKPTFNAVDVSSVNIMTCQLIMSHVGDTSMMLNASLPIVCPTMQQTLGITLDQKKKV